MLSSYKSQATTKQADLAFHGVSMPPKSVRSRWNEANYGRSKLRGLEGLLHPASDLSTVWGIHPDHVVPPVLLQAVFIAREVPDAPGILVRRAGVEGKLELPV